MGKIKNCFRPTIAEDSGRLDCNTKEGMPWRTNKSAIYVYFTNAPTKDRILPILVLTRELKEVFGTMMLNYPVNDSVESSSSSDEEDSNFILLELDCIPKRCFEMRLLDGRLLERLKMDVNLGGRRRTVPTTLQYVSGELYIFQKAVNRLFYASKFTKRWTLEYRTRKKPT